MRKRALYIALAILIVIGLCSCGDITEKPVLSGDVIEVHFLDVGQADSAVVLCGGAVMLIDGGNVADNQFVVAYLSGLGIDYIDYVVCTHAHEDHVGGLAGVMAAFDAGTVFCPVDSFNTKAFSDFVKYVEARNLSLTAPEPGYQFELGGAIVTVLAPLKDYSDVNNTSIVLCIDYGDVSFMFTGDAERDSENDIMDCYTDIDCTVLKVGHHGSRSSTSYRWLYEVQPEYAVISCGRDNDYGHPHEEVTSRLRDANITVHRTDRQGTIICQSDGASIVFETEINVTPESAKADSSASLYYIGNINSKKFHTPDCSGLPAEKNRIIFETRAEAVNAGYDPCNICKP